jgi:hypothetical protein
MRAYVDESEPGGGLDHTTYLLAAVLLTHGALDDARRDVEAARPPRMRKLHWYEALSTQRVSWLELLRHAVEVLVIRYDGLPARPERRRRRCLERLVHELETRGITELVLESRGPHLDRSDRRMFDAFRTRGLGRALRHEHLRGTDEPLLALADLVCGAHAAGATDIDHGLREIVVD